MTVTSPTSGSTPLTPGQATTASSRMHVSTAGQKRRLPDTMPENRRSSLRHATTAASTEQLLALEHATKLLGQFSGDSAPWTTQEKQDKLDNIALFVSVMSPEDQVVRSDRSFCIPCFSAMLVP